MHSLTLSDRQIPADLGAKLDPAHTALVLIDMQNEFCSPRGYVAQQGWDITPMQAMAERLRGFVAAARRHVRVIHVRGQYEPVYLVDQMVDRLHSANIAPYCQPGTHGWKFYPGFEPEAGEIVVTKRSYSGFANTELELVLRNLHVRTFVAAGTFTNVCVDTTVRDGYARGFYPVIAEDLTACPEPEQHSAALATLGRFFGTVVPSARITELWDAYYQPTAPV